MHFCSTLFNFLQVMLRTTHVCITAGFLKDETPGLLWGLGSACPKLDPRPVSESSRLAPDRLVNGFPKENLASNY